MRRRVQAKRFLVVELDDDIHVKGTRNVVVDGDATLHVGGDYVILLEGDKRGTILGNLEQAVLGDKTVIVTGNHSEQVGQAISEVSGKDNTRTAGGNIAEAAPQIQHNLGAKPRMSCQVEIAEVGGCLEDFFEALPPGTLDHVVETLDEVLARTSDATFARVDGAIRALERKVAALLSERNTVTAQLARVQGVIDEAEQFLREIDCPELRVLKEMWDDQQRELANRLAAIDTGPVEDGLRKHRELRTSLTCQRANARKVADFVRSFRGA